jgi:hypothetical protein
MEIIKPFAEKPASAVVTSKAKAPAKTKAKVAK